MSDFMQQALSRKPERVPEWLLAIGNAGTQRWQQHQFPTRRTEDWKYTNLRALETGNYFETPAKQPQEVESLRNCFAIAELDSIDLVFVNGIFSKELSTENWQQFLPENAYIVCFSEADQAQSEEINGHLDSAIVGNKEVKGKHLFAALNNSLLEDGVFIKIGKQTQLSKPLRVVWLTTPQDKPFTVAQRLLLVMEEGSAATIVEHFVSTDEKQNSFTNGISEFCLHDNSQLTHYRLQQEEEHALHIGGVHVALQRNAQLDSFHLALGSTLKRVDVVVNHLGEGAHCELNGVYLPRGSQHVDYHTCIEHKVPHCTTNEVFRGIVGDSARAVFNGRIHIHPDAQKTSAQLSNKNLLTSDKAEVDTKPELEIYADDVQCAHGATVAQLEEKSLHYLRTRGVSEAEARVMLSFGFINELVNKIQSQAIADYLRLKLAELFARDPKLARHIG